MIFDDDDDDEIEKYGNRIEKEQDEK